MSETSIATPMQFTDTDLAAIVADASFLWERLNSDRFTVDPDRIDRSEIDRRCDRWCQTVSHEGKGEILQKRLQWEGLNLEDLRPCLGKVRLAAGENLPTWAETLRQIVRTAAAFDSNAAMPWPTKANQPVPFEDIWLPAIQVARQNLLIRLGTAANLPLSLLSAQARTSLERSLLQRLSLLSAKTLDLEFSKARTFGQNLLNLLGIEAETGKSKTQYHQFVKRLLEDGLFGFLHTYPVLGRFIAVAVNFWVEATAEFIQRLASDRAEIQQVFNLENREKSPLGKVSEIETSLSDPHNQGRTVILLTFESGLKLVYKPKDLGLEVAWNQFLAWCNQQSQPLDLKVIQVFDRDGYGWVEYVEHQPCRDETAIERFYQRAGMLLCLIYVLRGNDCHYENLIASGEHLVLIDMETLLHHDPQVLDDSPEFPAFETESTRLFWDSVLRTGMLPRWDFGPDRRVAYDISGLGRTDPQQAPQKIQRWQAINTDEMHLRAETVTLPIQKNVPLLGDSPLSPNDYQVQIVAGFEQMYRFLVQHRGQLLAADSPLAALQHQKVRFIFRATRIYFTILSNTWTPDYLKNGTDYSIELDRLSRAFLVARTQPDAWPILKAELRAMEQLDIPFFTANTSSDALELKNIPVIPQYFKQASYQQVLEQFQALDESDLARQVAIIQGAFSARMAQPSTDKGQPWQEEVLPRLDTEQLIQEARAIAAELEGRALQDADGSLNWIGMGFVPQAERFQLQLLEDSLYDGRCGVALFLAGLYRVTRESHFSDLSLRVLQPLRQRLKTLDSESRGRFVRRMGLGGAAGLGSIIYAFVTIAQFLGDDTLLTEAQILADAIAPETIASDRTLDIIGGVAGTILGLLPLYHATREVSVLEKAIACGQNLLTHQNHPEEGPKAWQTLGEKPLTGFSHGAAGMAYALLRLYAATDDPRYRDAALEGMDYEGRVFSQSEANWPDFRDLNPGETSAFPVQWCHGAAGIGLGRLGCSSILKTDAIEQDIQVALQTTQQQGLKPVDHLCCGNLGLAEVLLVAAKQCDRPDWRRVALQKATTVVVRAREAGSYQLFSNLPSSVFNPGFFQGLSGIGYELLRLAHEELPSVLLWESMG